MSQKEESNVQAEDSTNTSDCVSSQDDASPPSYASLEIPSRDGISTSAPANVTNSVSGQNSSKKNSSPSKHLASSSCKPSTSAYSFTFVPKTTPGKDESGGSMEMKVNISGSRRLESSFLVSTKTVSKPLAVEGRGFTSSSNTNTYSIQGKLNVSVPQKAVSTNIPPLNQASTLRDVRRPTLNNRVRSKTAINILVLAMIFFVLLIIVNLLEFLRKRRVWDDDGLE